MSDSNKKYLDLITSEYADKENFKSYVESYLLKISDTVNILEDFDNLFNINDSGKFFLSVNMYGEMFGLPSIEYLLGKDNLKNRRIYIFLLKAKILKNFWDGTIEGLKNLFMELFPDNTFSINDNQDMSCIIEISGAGVSDKVKELIENGEVFPKPSGVSMQYVVRTDPLFGWDNEEETVGWDSGQWSIL